jgi:hypothetical protein
MIRDPFPATREQIIARHPLLEYCKALGWELKKRGRNWECLCPLHDDKNPSSFPAAQRLEVLRLRHGWVGD